MVRRFLLAALGLATTLMSVDALAEGRADMPVDARAWLARVHEAASLRNYQGTQVFTAGGVVSSSRIAHYCDGSQQYERVDMLDGQMRRVFRHNDTVYTVWPQRQIAVVEQREPLPPFPALLQAGGDRLTEYYELMSQGSDRLAGYDAEVFLLKPRDALRFGQRLWAERSTGLLLRTDVLGAHGEVLESSAFSEVAIGVRAQPETVLQPMKKLEGYRVVRPAVTATQLEGEGWAMKQGVPGFRQISCVKRPLTAGLPDVGRNAGPAEVLQTIFSDGLTHVSLFIEPFDSQRHQRPMHTAVGATHTLMQRQGEWWITVVGDVPTSTLKQFAGALERRK
ncbi:MucB/RseB C-terminal domain-containing protein [Ideonella sp. BN130291]|uniref:MucB/RseB C-terminal domain-containing protein n=1 Tax=Ideonella sp. BN130291 TaxID=3112940 RepID=UPI002E260788